MYICLSCRGTFTDPKITYEVHNELEGSPSEDFLVCPYCGDTDFSEAIECDGCGEYFSAEENHFADDVSHSFCSKECALDFYEIIEVDAS